MKLQISDPLR